MSDGGLSNMGNEVETGQRREWNPSQRQHMRGQFVVEDASDGWFLCRYANGDTGLRWSAQELAARSALVASPSSPGRPKPAKGQRWRGGKSGYNKREPFTLGDFDGVYWRVTANSYDGWAPESFENGVLEFVDHGQTEARAPEADLVKVCDVCKCATWPGLPLPAHAPDCPRYNTNATRRSAPAAVVALKPLREVYAGGAWLPYDKLGDPDPFHMYKRRRENGVEAAVVEPRGYDGKTFREHARYDYDSALRTLIRESYVCPPPAPAPLTPWLSTDTKPSEPRAYRRRSPGGGS